MKALTISLLTAVVAVSSWAQMRGPVSGLIVDPQTHAVRQVLGVPGAAYAGSGIIDHAEFVAVAADGRTAFVVRKTTLYAVTGLDGDSPVWRTLGESKAAIGAAAWSADGNSLALYFPSRSMLRIWTGVQESIEPAGEIDLSMLEGRLGALAVASDGRSAFAAIDLEDTGSLYLLRPGQSPRLLMGVGKGALLALSGSSLYAADRERNLVHRFEGWESNPAITTVATAAHGVADPVGIAVSAGGRRLFVANRGTRQVLAINPTTSTVEAVTDLDFTPSRLVPSGRFLLLADGEAGQTPAQVLDPERMSVHFVPLPAVGDSPKVE